MKDWSEGSIGGFGCCRGKLNLSTSCLLLLCNYPWCSMLSVFLSPVVLTGLRLEVNFLPQHFSHHLHSGGTPRGMNCSKAELSRPEIKLCRCNSDYAGLQTGKFDYIRTEGWKQKGQTYRGILDNTRKVSACSATRAEQKGSCCSFQC